MTQEDQNLLQEYVRVRTTPMRIFVEVKMVDAERDEVLSARWSLSCVLPANATPLQVDRARMIALADYRYFRTYGDMVSMWPGAWAGIRIGK